MSIRTFKSILEPLFLGGSGRLARIEDHGNSSAAVSGFKGIVKHKTNKERTIAV